MTSCIKCAQPLDRAAILTADDTCTDCRRRELIAAARRAGQRGQSVALANRPDERARVEAAIRQLAATGQPFSANSAREIHGCRGPVVGATFNALKAEGVIEPIGEEPSTDRGTHGKRVALWKAVA